MSNKEELRQALMELHYDLLDDQEAQRLRSAIETDPEVAAEWAHTLKLAGQMANAARLQQANLPKVDLTRLAAQPASGSGTESSSDPAVGRASHPAQAAPSSNGQVKPTDAAPILAELADADVEPPQQDAAANVAPAKPASMSRWWWKSGLLAATAASIGLIVLANWYQQQLPPTPTAALSLQAEAASGDRAQSDHEYHFVTRRLDSPSATGDFPVTPASLSFSVLSRGVVLFSGNSKTDGTGEGRIVLPDDLVIPDGSQLRVTATSADGRLTQSVLEVPLEPTRCLTYLTIDRPVYRPGETVLFRSLTLQRRSFRPNVEVPIRFELIDPSGAMVAGAFIEGVTDRGVGNGAFQIPSAASGGSYTLIAKSLDGFFPDEKREIQVRAYRVPRFKKELEFRRRSYGPGETVEAEFSAERAEGGPVAAAPLMITATVDDQVVHRESARTSDTGSCVISFELPDHIQGGVGNLSVAIDDGGTRETQSKTIPIQLGRVAVDFYPEGGYLVEGLRNRVYFAARDSLGEPIHLAGEVITRSGQQVAQIETVRDGMGRFELTPVRGERYMLKVSSPVDVTNTPRLPAAVKDLPVIDTGLGVFESGKPLSVTIGSNSQRGVLLRAVCRGQLVGQKELSLQAGENSVSLKIRDNVAGVIRLTVLDVGSRKPLVERLVFRRPDKGLKVEVVSDESALERSPGEPLRLKLQIRNERGEATPAVLGVAVVDDAALSLDETERPTLATHFLLTSEVEKPEDLEHANFYLSDDPDAGLSLDLLLGTQGWRRFVSGTNTPNVDFREQLIRLLELDGDDVASAPARFDNSAGAKQSWGRYRAAAGAAWDRLLLQAQLLMVAVLLIWLGAIIVRLRHQGRAAPGVHSALTTLVILSTSLAIYGCSVQEASVVATSERANDSMREAEAAGSEAEESSMNAMPHKNESRDRAEPRSESPTPALEPAEDDAAAGGPSESTSKPTDPGKDMGMLGGGFGNDELSERIDSDKYGPGDSGLGDRAAFTSTDGRAISPQDLEKLLSARGLDAESLADQLIDELRFPVRQYAHQHRKPEGDLRQDFTETLYWQPLLATDSQGTATIRFDLSDSVTSFRVHVDGHTVDGRIGSGGEIVTSRLPLQIEPKLPLEVTTGDRIDLPVAVINTTDAELGVALTLDADPALRVSEDASRTLLLPAKGRQREVISLDVLEGAAEKDASIQVRGVADGSLSDTVRRQLHISPAGYPARQSMAGVLNERAKLRLPIPEDIVDGSLAVTLRAYPSPLADVMSGIEGILREPHGCFEQTSATNYPNTMALLYMKQNKVANPDVSRRARGMLDRGYGKLTSFECEKRGYEWFGHDPGHEALSAFGLMQFNDMSRVMNVSQEMVTRTRKWLMGRRDGNGGFKRNPRHLHVWSVQQPIVNAYVLWAITEADVAAGHGHRSSSELGPELDELTRHAVQSDDPYVIALSAAALMNAKRTPDGEALLQKLVPLQAADGMLVGKTTVTSSGGISLKMETTAIATLAWLKSPRHLPQAKAAAKWITLNRQGNSGFGSTQATVLALKALVAVSDHLKGQSSGGDLIVELRGEEIGRVALPSDPQSGSTVELAGLATHLQDAEADVEIELIAKGTKHLSFVIDLSYHAVTPDSHADCPLTLQTEMPDGQEVVAGDVVTVKTRTVNVTDSGLPMTVSIVGLPGGLEPRPAELDELRDAGKFDYYELRGREVIFYWRTIEPRAVKEIDFSVTAEIPGRYTAPASRTYLYYTAEQKNWVRPLSVEIDR